MTYNTLLNGYGQVGDREMVRNGVKADILTINALILGLCKVGRQRRLQGLLESLIRRTWYPMQVRFLHLLLGSV